MKINLTSIPVQDQQHALAFYTEKLGFVKKEDSPMGEYRWLTVTSLQGAEGVELLLEPLGYRPAKDYYKALFESGIPAAQFETDDLNSEMERMKEAGVSFRGEPEEMEGVRYVIFDDTCG